MHSDNESRQDEMSVNEKIIQFIQKNRTGLFVAFISILVILAGLIIYVTVSDAINEKALTRVDEFERRYTELMPDIAVEDGAISPKQPEITTLLDDLTTFTQKNSGFPAARAYTIIAEINWTQKNWEAAEKAWADSAQASAKTYLGPISLFNAAAAAEERGDIQAAIDYYSRAAAYDSEFPMAPRAQFAIGRLEESRESRNSALEAYRLLVSKWPTDPLWADLAQSRIIILSE